MVYPGPPCPLCGRRGAWYGPAWCKVYLPPLGHRGRVMVWADVSRTPPGRRPADVRYDLCPMLDGELPGGFDD